MDRSGGAGQKEDHYKILYGETGHTYESIFGKYLPGCKQILIEDPYIRTQHQIQNIVRFCELVVKIGSASRIDLLTGYDNQSQLAEVNEKLDMLQESLKELGITFAWKVDENIHDRKVRLDNGWIIKVGRGFDIYQRPENWFSVGSQTHELRPCLETEVDIYREKKLS